MAFATGFAQQKVKIKTVPSWVVEEPYDINPDINEVSQGSFMLLADYQINIPKQQFYYKSVTKITENLGIQDASNINVVFDPLYQELVFHTITVKRGDEVIDKLSKTDFQILKRELNAENHLYDGSLSAMTNLSDIRLNDIVEFSYSIIGFNPIHNNKYSNSFYLNDAVPIGEINIHILSENDLNYKFINSKGSLKTTSFNGLKQYKWNAVQPEPAIYEDATPTWKITHPMLLISDYNSWKEVVDWGVDVFSINEKPSASLQKKINEIDKKYTKEGEKIKAVLNFVQDEIRYLGFEQGIGSYKPNNPNKVFEQRYGDCKDKCLLVTTMLDKLGVESYPMLLNTTLHHTIENLLPTPELFDHCVVKVIDKEGYELYYDPTSTNQGGTFKNTHFANYEYGLVLKPNTDAFDKIISSSENLVTTAEEFILEKTGKGAVLKIETTYNDVEADIMRNYFKNNSIAAINKEYENYYSNYYYNIKSLKTTEYKDDINKNAFVTFEEYKIDSLWQPMENKESYIQASFTPISFFNILYIPTKEDRKHEISLPYPVARKHTIKVKLQDSWDIKNDSGLISSDFFFYDYEVKYNRKEREINLSYYLKTQKKAVLPSELKAYNKDINELDESVGYMLYIPKSTASIKEMFDEDSFVSSTAILILGLVLLVLFIGGLVFLIVKLTKKG